MIMRKIRLYIAIVISMLCVTSCQGFLQEDPLTSLSADDYNTTISEINMRVWGSYSLISSAGAFGNDILHTLSALTFETQCGTSSAEYLFAIDPYYTNGSDIWAQLYLTIGNCNITLNRILEIEDTFDEDEIMVLKGELYFLRALSYFYLVRLYGDIPIELGDEEYAISDTVNPRSPILQVYEEVIIPDLKRAEEMLPIENPYDVGRAKRVAAAGILAKVYCTMAGSPLYDIDRWQDAYDKLIEIVDTSNPAQSLAPYTNALQEDFQDLFYKASYMTSNSYNVIEKDAIENGVESIFEINYRDESGYYSCNWPNTSGYKSKNVAVWLRAGVAGDAKKFFETNDARKKVSMTLAGEMESPSNGWVQKKFPRTNETLSAGFDNNAIVMRYAELLTLLAEADTEVNGEVTQLGKDCVNALRKRAREGATYANATTPADLIESEYSSPDVFKQFIIKERIIEHYLEGVFWFDILRHRNLKEIIELQQANSDGANRYYDEKIYLLPIPADEIQASGGVLTQNSGY